MSDDYMKLVPTDVSYVPSAKAQRKAVELLRAFAPDADEVSAETAEQVEFIDCGSNWSGVRCPHCGVTLEDEWWSDAVDASSATGFANLAVDLPCCGRPGALSDLDYIWPVGFARFTLQARNANLGGQLPAEKASQLESVLGCRLRVILAHY
jgi:hypothetical protein